MDKETTKKEISKSEMKKNKSLIDIVEYQEFEDSEKFELDDILDVCLKYTNKEITKKEFEKYLKETIKMVSLISVDLKKLYIDLFYSLNELQENDFSDMSYNFELFTVSVFLFSYTNVIPKIEGMSGEKYDLIMESKLFDYIFENCKDDYSRWIKMFERSVAFRNAYIFDALNLSVDLKDVGDLLIKSQKDFSELDDKKLEYVSNILDANDTSIKDMKHSIFNVTKPELNIINSKIKNKNKNENKKE